MNGIETNSHKILHRDSKDILVVLKCPNASPRRSVNDSTHRVKSMMTFVNKPKYTAINACKEPNGKSINPELLRGEVAPFIGKKIIAFGEFADTALSTVLGLTRGEDYITIPHPSPQSPKWNKLKDRIEYAEQITEYLES